MKLVKALLESVFRAECRVAAAWVANAHRRLFAANWLLKPTPNHFNHDIDLYAQWRRTRNPMWVERGCHSGLALRGGRVLELACGDGFNARNFYSLASTEVVACDIDERAIAFARRHNGARNVRYQVRDLRNGLPDGGFDNVVFDFGYPLLEYFTIGELGALLRRVAAVLGGQGVFSGYTVAQPVGADGQPCFDSAASLRGFLGTEFRNVTVYERISPGRRNLYFWASQGAVPFGA